MAGHPAVGVHDDLAAREAAVAERAADHEDAGGVDVEGDVLVPHLEALEHRAHDPGDDVLAQLVVADLRRVLRGEHDRHDLGRHAVHVAHGDLGLAVGAQVRQIAPALLREALADAVGQRDRQRHELGRLVGGVAEHQALVAGALQVVPVAGGAGALLVRGVDALRDVGALLVERHRDAAGLGVEAVLGARVADAADRRADDGRDVDVGGGRDLAGHHDLPGGDERLAGHAAERVVGQDRVEDPVRDLIGDLVGVSLGDGFRGEEVLSHRLRLLGGSRRRRA